ncbi:MAG: hypothetical protein ACPHER_09850, partial [Nevskiales bacterium]
LNRKVKYKKLPLFVIGLALRAKGMDSWSVTHRKQILRLFLQGSGSKASDAVQRITGHPPRNLRSFVGDTFSHWQLAK